MKVKNSIGKVRVVTMAAVISNRDKVTYGEIADHYQSNKFLFGIKYLKN